MTTVFPLPDSLFQGPSSMRILRIDTHWRYATAMYKAHGARPDHYENAVMSGLGANYVLRGAGRYTDWDGQTYPLAPGTFFQRLPGKAHGTWIDPKSDYAEFYLTLDPETSQMLIQLGLIAPTPVFDVGVNGMILEEFRHLLAKMAAAESEVPSPVMLIQIIQFLNGMYERARQASGLGYWNGIIGQACVILENDLDQRRDLEAVARELGVSYPTFRKRFRDVMGTSPGEYRVRYRLERACGMLMDHSIKSVAADLGYCDPFTFSAQFKSFVGVSPREFQDRMKRTQENTAGPKQLF